MNKFDAETWTGSLKLVSFSFFLSFFAFGNLTKNILHVVV